MNTEHRPRHVLVVEDHAVVRQGLHLLLEREGEFVVSGEAATLSEALAPSEDPDLILTDLILAETQGRTVIETLRNRYPRTPILVLSMMDHPDEVRTALGAGANGYLLKETAAEELIQALHQIAAARDTCNPRWGPRSVVRSSCETPPGSRSH